LAIKISETLVRSFHDRIDHVYFIFEKHKIYLNRNSISLFLEGIPVGIRLSGNYFREITVEKIRKSKLN